MIKKVKGVTMIELIIAISIISISIVGLLTVFRVNILNSADPVTRKQAVLIAEGIMEEVLSKDFTKEVGGYAGPYTNINRSKFDSIQDYNNLNISGMTNIYGDALPGLENYNANITVVGKEIGTLSITESSIITVVVTGPNDMFTLKGYKLNY